MGRITRYVQVKYYKEGTTESDFIQFTLPGHIQRAEFDNACIRAAVHFSKYENQDMDEVDLTSDMLDEIAAKLGGTWEYMRIAGTIEVDEGARTYSRSWWDVE